MDLGTSAFDLQKDLKDVSKESAPNLFSHSLKEVIAVHAKTPKQFNTNQLKWRCSGGAKRALGWVPLKVGSAVWTEGQVRYNGPLFKVWDSYGLAQYTFRFGSFCEDSRARWYFNVVIEVPVAPNGMTSAVGIDLGFKDDATCSDGSRLWMQSYGRRNSSSLGRGGIKMNPS